MKFDHNYALLSRPDGDCVVVLLRALSTTELKVPFKKEKPAPPLARASRERRRGARHAASIVPILSANRYYWGWEIDDGWVAIRTRQRA